MCQVEERAWEEGARWKMVGGVAGPEGCEQGYSEGVSVCVERTWHLREEKIAFL